MQINKDTIFQLNWQNPRAYYSLLLLGRRLGHRHLGMAEGVQQDATLSEVSWQSLSPNLECTFLWIH